MTRAATILILAAAALLPMPWQICDCEADGPHLKAVWDHAACEHDDSDETPDPDCGRLFHFAGSLAGAPVTLLGPDELGRSIETALGSVACEAGGERLLVAALVEPPGTPVRPPAPAFLAARLLL